MNLLTTQLTLCFPKEHIQKDTSTTIQLVDNEFEEWVAISQYLTSKDFDNEKPQIIRFDLDEWALVNRAVRKLIREKKKNMRGS